LSNAEAVLASHDDVVNCYRLFLGRDPESAEVVAHHLSSKPTIWGLVQAFTTSDEAALFNIDRACAAICGRQDARGVDVHIPDDAAAKLNAHISEVWSKYGRENAFFSVLTNPDYLAKRITDEVKEDFYATGAIDVRFFDEVCQRNAIELPPSRTVLDLGCGVGRIGEHLAQRFESYVGVDISSEHLAIAQRRLHAKKLLNTQFSLLSDELKSTRQFDIFYSNIVLQHNPPPIIYRILDAFLPRLNSGGIGYFQLPCYLYNYSFNVADYLNGKGMRSDMEMHALPQRYVFELLAKHGLTPVEVIPNPRIGPIGYSYSFLASKR
jgi:SAM-dependent methyltransferase